MKQTQNPETKLPTLAYLGLLIEETRVQVAIKESGQKETVSFPDFPVTKQNMEKQVLNWVEKINLEKKYKFVGAGLFSPTKNQKALFSLGAKLWLEQDIVPILTHNNHSDAIKLAQVTAAGFDDNGILKIKLLENNEVLVNELIGLKEFRQSSTKQEFDLLLKLANQFQNKKMVFLNATPQGGGVALMRHALVRLYRLLNLDIHWHVLSEKPEAFEITKKKFHNVLQSVADPEMRLTTKDRVIYRSWIAENVEILKPVLQKADVIIIDDPQPSGLVPYIREMNNDVQIIYRSHIQLETKLMAQTDTPQAETWKFIWENIKSADCFISHPIKDFIPPQFPLEKTILAPATTDPLDGLNKPLTHDQENYYLERFNEILIKAGQTPLDLNREYITQIARFDPSKGILDVIEAYRQLCEKMPQKNRPQLVICGHGSVDDPDGEPIYELITQTLMLDRYKPLACDIKVARLPHVDQLLNAILRRAKVALQLSHKEGFEVKVTEALMKGVPVIAYQAGGIPLQIQNNVTGFLVPEIGNTSEVAEKLFTLFTNKKLYEKMSAKAAKLSRRDVLTVPNAIRWLHLANSLLSYQQTAEITVPKPVQTDLAQADQYFLSTADL